MSYRYSKNPINQEIELIIEGFENGIASSPHQGIADMRNVNIDSLSGSVMCNYKLVSNSPSGGTLTVSSVDTGADTVTVTGLTPLLSNGLVIGIYSTSSVPAGLTQGQAYFIVNYSSGGGNQTFGLSLTSGGAAVNITGSGAGTITISYNVMGAPKYWTYDTASTNYYIIDSNGRVWKSIGYDSLWTFAGGDTVNASGNGIVAYQSYIFVYRNGVIDYIKSDGNYVASWQTMNTPVGTPFSHYALSGYDNTVYYCDASYIGSIGQVGSTTFNPAGTNNIDYTWTKLAFTLPAFETSNTLEQQDNNLLIGTLASNFVYTWNKLSLIISAENNAVFPLPEVKVSRMININRLVYIFAGVRGNIYIYNGSQAILFHSMSYYLTQSVNPTITWGDAMVYKNRLFFSLLDVGNHCGGVYSIDLTTKVMLYENVNSTLNYNTYSPVLISEVNIHPLYVSYMAGWTNGSTFGIDYLNTQTPTLYSNYDSYVETDFIDIGSVLQKKTWSQIEFNLDEPLASGEKIKLSWRGNLNDSYTLCGETTFAIDGASSGALYILNSGALQNIQIKAQMQSTGATFVRLNGIRIH